MEAEQKYLRHEELCKDLTRLYIAKNKAYDDSFGKQIDEWGIIPAVIRMSDKMLRIKALAKGVQNDVEDESILESSGDLANYCLMLIIELERISGQKFEFASLKKLDQKL